MSVFDVLDDDLDEIRLRCASDDAGIRRVAMMDLAEMVEPEAAALLLHGLRDQATEVRVAAAKALDEHDSPDVVMGLVAALEDVNVAVREAAAETLADKREMSCGPLLIARARDGNPFVQAAAFRALRELVLPEALEVAVASLTSPDDAVRREAIGVIGYLKAESALPDMMMLAGDPMPEVRLAAMAALVFIQPGSPGAATLLKGLSDPHWQVREQAAVSIAKVRLTDAVDLLIAAMQDEAWQIRVKAAYALGRLKAVDAIPALGPSLSSDIPNLRKEVAAAFGEMAHPAALPWLEQARHDLDPDVRKLIIWALGRCQPVA